MSQQTIDYADSITASGISYTPSEHGCEILFPVGLTHRGRATFFAEFTREIAACGFGAGIFVCFLNLWVGVAIVLSVLLALVLILWLDKLLVARAARDEQLVSDTALEITIPGQSGAHDLKWSAPRDRIRDVKFVSHSGNLVVRAHGQEMFDEHLHDDLRVTAWIVERLRRHLTLEADGSPQAKR